MNRMFRDRTFDGYWYGKMVQRREGLRLHRARARRQGCFRHISAVEQAGMRGLAEGQKVSYDVKPDRGKESAVNLAAV